jgi:hypothetical protein
VFKILSAETYYRRQFAAWLHGVFTDKPSIGDARVQFLKELQARYHAYDPTKHQGKIIPIWQSDGTGKSRMLSDYAKTVSGARVLPTLNVTLLLAVCLDLAPQRHYQGQEPYPLGMASSR